MSKADLPTIKRIPTYVMLYLCGSRSCEIHGGHQQRPTTFIAFFSSFIVNVIVVLRQGRMSISSLVLALCSVSRSTVNVSHFSSPEPFLDFSRCITATEGLGYWGFQLLLVVQKLVLLPHILKHSHHSGCSLISKMWLGIVVYEGKQLALHTRSTP